MGQPLKKKVRIIELTKDMTSLPKLMYQYVTSSYYDISISHKANSWQINLILKPLEVSVKKKHESKFFTDFVEEPRAFAAEVEGEQIGWLELGYHKWNKRIRVWEFLVKQEFRRKGIGTLLMNHAVKLAKERGARMVVLETQTCNVPAIKFYLTYGFALIGFDTTAYSNEDIEKKEFRLEFGVSTL